MGRHYYLITIETSAPHQASQVIDGLHTMSPTLAPSIESQIIYGKPLFMLTTTDMERALRRPLAPGEERPMTKALESALGPEWTAVVDDWDDPETAEMSAAGLTAGHWYCEYGMDDWYRVTKTDWHGDTLLLWVENVEGDPLQTTLDGDTMVQILVTNQGLRP